MTREDFMNYTKYSNGSASVAINRLIKYGVILEDLIYVVEEDFEGFLDSKTLQIVMKNKSYKIVTCSNCSSANKISYIVWEKKEEDNKNLCAHCSRSKCLSNLNRTKIREKVEAYWSDEERSRNYRDFLSKSQIDRNKNYIPDKIKNFSIDKKIEIKNKKINTWNNRTEEEKEKINKKRNIYMNFTEEQRKNYIEKMKISMNEPELKKRNSEKAKERWRLMSESEKIFFIKNWHKHSGAKVSIHEDLDIYYQGSYEKYFLDECLLKDLNVERGPCLDYFDTRTNKLRKYFLDFICEGFLVEIKSEYWYNVHKETCDCKARAAKNYCIQNNLRDYLLILIDDKNLKEKVGEAVETIENKVDN